MKICMLAYTFYDYDNRVKRYAEYLVENGHEVDVISLKIPTQNAFDTVKGVSVYRIQTRIVNEKSKYDYLFRTLTFLARSFFFLSFRHLRRRYDIIHVHNPPDYAIAAALIVKLTGGKLILDVHDIVPEFFMSKFDKTYDSTVIKALLLIERFAIHLSDYLIFSNHLWEEKVTKRCNSRVKSVTILNYPQPDIFRRVDSRPNEQDAFNLVYPGSLNTHQGLDVAVRAMSLIKEEEPPVFIYLYADGPERENLERLTIELGLEKRIFFKEMVTIEELPKLMRHMHAGIVPKQKNSFGNEAFSTKILEFMSMGLPVIVSDTKIDQYYFTDKQVRFFNSGDPASLAQAVSEVKNNPALRKSMIEESQKYIAQNNWHVRQADYRAVVQALSGNRSFS